MKLIYEHKRIFGLDLMRAIAITLVLFGHCAWIYPEPGFLLQIMSLAGFLGVEIFFVLSGFLIGKILLQMYTAEKFNFNSVLLFLKRRWFRTLPNYYLVLLINLIIASYVGYEILEPWRYFVFLQNFSDPLRPFFTESWSLSVEEFAYIFLPLALFIASVKTRKIRSFVYCVLALIAIVTINRIIYHNSVGITSLGSWNIALKSVVIFRMDSIFIGALCSVLYTRRNYSWIKFKFLSGFIGMIGIAFISVGVGYFGLFIESYPLFWNVFYLPMVSVIVALFLPILSEWKAAPLYLTKPITIISVLSYSMYLLHYGIVLQLMRYHFDVAALSTSSLALFTFLYFALTIAASFLLYTSYEKPMTDLREKAGLANLERFFPIRKKSRS